MSQSLWNRAVSYDLNYPTAKKGGKKVSIPLEQGSVLRLNEKQRRGQFPKSQSLWNRAVSYDVDRLTSTASQLVSIPLEQGSVLRRCRPLVCNCIWGVSIPLEQGSVLRLRELS